MKVTHLKIFGAAAGIGMWLSFFAAAQAAAVPHIPPRQTIELATTEIDNAGDGAGMHTTKASSATAKVRQQARQLEKPADANNNNHGQLKAAIINWKEIPNAVRYELRIKDVDTKKIVFTKYDIYAAGCQIDSTQVDFNQKLIWQVRGLNYDKVPLSDYTEWKWLTKGKVFTHDWQLEKVQPGSDKAAGEVMYNTYLVKDDVAVNPLKLTTQFDEMAFTPVYPVYSWVPIKNAANYKINVFKLSDDGSKTQIKSAQVAQSFDYYDETAYTKAGTYYFNVAAYDAAKQKIAQSADSLFTVHTDNVTLAALGDSITHGGGAISTPPSAILYNWETYANLPILNIGFSGNLTVNMLNRFDKDVVPFSPKLLVVMGGVNDIRTGVKAAAIINNLQAIKEKCKKHDIIPVFLTVTPINPPKMVNVGKIEAPSADWQTERQKVNAWIKTQDYYVDIAETMVDNRGYLKDELTTDGLHPDYEGKRHIGEAVGDYLRLYFPYLT